MAKPHLTTKILNPIQEVKQSDEIESINLDETKNNSINGLGDVVKAVTNFLGFETCDECEKRRQELNKIFPFFSQSTPLDNEDIKFIKYLNTLKMINHEEIKKLVTLYNKAFNQKINCTTCGTVLKSAIEKLYNLYLAKYSTDEKDFK